MITIYTKKYVNDLLTNIHKMEDKCSIDDYDQRRHIENMRMELNWLQCNGQYKRENHINKGSHLYKWKPKISHHARN